MVTLLLSFGVYGLPGPVPVPGCLPGCRAVLSCVAVGLCPSCDEFSLVESRGDPLEKGGVLRGGVSPSSELPLALTSLLPLGKEVPYVDRIDP